MKKIIYTFVFALVLVANAKAEDIESTRQQISNSLNTIVKDLKQYFSSTDRSLNTNLKNIKELEKDVTSLVERSEVAESEPTLLDHGKADIEKLKKCNYDSQNIHWTGSEWDCQNVNILIDCNAASDEYRVKQPDGSYRCQKNSPGTPISYYYKFEGYYPLCNYKKSMRDPKYSCFYRNKQGVEVNVQSSKCSGKSKPRVTNKSCMKADYVCSKGTLSNTKCIIKENMCKYNSSNYVIVSGGSGWCAGRGSVYIVEGKQVNGKGYSKGKRIKSISYGSCKGTKTKTTYEICGDFTSYQDAIIKCPGGYNLIGDTCFQN